jgi:ADP-ribosylglycohydrolase
MEDKWFIFFENNCLFMHRSWTGFGIYKACITKNDKGYSFKELWVERNQEKYKNEDDQSDIKIFLDLIAGSLLGIGAEIILNDETEVIKGWTTYGQFFYPIPVHASTGDIKAALLGVSVGDALGVPVEFESRLALSLQPVTDMRGGGVHRQIPGTWSDDSSLTFCLAEALTQKFDISIVADYFIKWYYFGYWSARNNVFDVGNATREAIIRMRNDVKPELAGSDDPHSNGNGSLMRILPLLFYIMDMPTDKRFDLTRDVSSMTHRHIRSILSCFYYLEFARMILMQGDKFEIYRYLQSWIPGFLKEKSIDSHQITFFDRLFNGNIGELSEKEISSDGYVLHTLEASIWCLLNTENFTDAVLAAVNLGGDSDTTGAVTGGLAGLYYGIDNIPEQWISRLAREEDINDLAERMAKYLEKHQSF